MLAAVGPAEETAALADSAIASVVACDFPSLDYFAADSPMTGMAAAAH